MPSVPGPNPREIPGALFLGFLGFLWFLGGVPVAGVGVAGASSGALDEQYARAGVAALGD